MVFVIQASSFRLIQDVRENRQAVVDRADPVRKGLCLIGIFANLCYSGV